MLHCKTTSSKLGCKKKWLHENSQKKCVKEIHCWKNNTEYFLWENDALIIEIRNEISDDTKVDRYRVVHWMIGLEFFMEFGLCDDGTIR